jgi:hypothetical protein
MHHESMLMSNDTCMPEGTQDAYATGTQAPFENLKNCGVWVVSHVAGCIIQLQN